MQIVQDYRALHTIPELDRTLPKTIAYIQNSLSALPCRVFSPTEGALCAFFDFGHAEAIAFRADMDALPILEETGLSWQSRHPGVMHACGHDGHCAILLELARRVSKRKELKYNCLLLFQPSEETSGGAEELCNCGIFEQYQVRCIFGLHLWPGLPKGKLFSRGGVLMSQGCGLTVRFLGKSAHIARFQEGADALDAAARFCHLTRHLTNRHQLVKFGKLSGGTAGNILCDHAELQGSLRTFRDCEKAQKKLTALCRAVARRTGCQGQIVFQRGYPAVWNCPHLFGAVKSAFPMHSLKKACFTTDDFSCYQQQVPGLYCLLGIGETPPLHSSRFAFDEGVLNIGADFFLSLFQNL